MPQTSDQIAMEVGAYYTFGISHGATLGASFEGWTDFGWMAFTFVNADDYSTETKFYNPAHLVTIRPETFASVVSPGYEQN